MATRALSPQSAADVRAAFRRSLRRAAQMTGAGVLFCAMLFLGLAMLSYTQTDPSPSTAAAADPLRERTDELSGGHALGRRGQRLCHLWKGVKRS